MMAGWSSGLRSRLRNQRSRAPTPAVSKGFCDEPLHLLTSHGCLHSYYSRFIPEGVAEASHIFLRDTHVLRNYLAMSNTTDLVPFYDIHGRKREVLFFYFVPDTTRD
jgi:hypothetical protein